MKKLILACALCSPLFLLNACSEKNAEKGVYTAEATYVLLAKAADQYETGKLGIIPDANIIALIKQYEQTAYTDITALSTKAQAGQAITATEELSVTQAVETLKDFLTEKGIYTGE
ncbi:hypothetical protein [Novacetimonas hansenii]|uniref:Uncharacterized protein n=1 Tax=Novacetimonas hansenii TaxID=436 RepID=A0ABQ0SH12_NOVHA|nr:hypothetical protein [Novacetimonas hansenii]GAN84019.1 hypothetical protein Gaha_0122_019 [Novacetimonas hansenii JCM 7643]GBQ55776.1 hypothetical protein AA0243_1007 [Novacetimonas hansenii NRIC 0243]GEC64599.1 hypothetical protein GHA01_24480 [Novacetimonas hansenii]